MPTTAKDTSLPPLPAALDEMVSSLEATGNFRVLRRLVPREPNGMAVANTSKLGIILDVETTGLDYRRHEVIEIAMIKFWYSEIDEIIAIADVFQSFNDPGEPIPAAITELTGITDVIVAGHKIDPKAVDCFVADARVVISHNAAFDRPFAEKLRPIFFQKNWACSLTEIDWKAHGFDGGKLGHLLGGFGLFHDAHRAVDDCHALLEILARRPPGNSETMLATLLKHARRKTVRVWADNSPYELKDVLKARGYRWSDGSDGSRRAWYVDVDEQDHGAEIDYLRKEIYQREVGLSCKEMDALTRFSSGSK